MSGEWRGELADDPEEKQKILNETLRDLGQWRQWCVVAVDGVAGWHATEQEAERDAKYRARQEGGGWFCVVRVHSIFEVVPKPELVVQRLPKEG